MRKEIWKPIKDYEDYYEVSNFGNVRSKGRKVWNGKGFYFKKGRLLKKIKHSTDCWKVELYINGNRKGHRVHRLVAEAFIEKIDGKDLVNHLDGNRLNNHVSNLEWCDQKRNMQHMYEYGLKESNFHKNKEKILIEYVNDEKCTISKLSKKYKCSHSTIKKYLKSNGIPIKHISELQNKYHIDKKKMVQYFQQGLKNKEIINKLGGNRQLIAQYRYLYKKGELKI